MTLAVVLSLVGLSLWAGLGQAPESRSEVPAGTSAPAGRATAFPGLAGTASCSGRACHGGLEPAAGRERTLSLDEYTKWLGADKHAQAYQDLFGERSLRIAKNLGITHAHLADRCLACHVNPLAAEPMASDLTRAERTFGVGCESCHGSAEKWRDPHTAKGWNPQKSHEYGMIDVADPLALAPRCTGCHVGAPRGTEAPVDRDVNHDLIAAGHPRLSFELTAYLANLPPHWNTSKRKATEVQTWALGQVLCGQAALRLLAFRAQQAKTAPWPEFAEYDCFACHHDLGQPSWRQKGYGKRPPGALPWSDWYVGMPRLLAGNGSVVAKQLEELRKEMEMPLPNAEAVAKRAFGLAGPLDKLRDRVMMKFDPKDLRDLLWPFSKEQPETARMNWDTGEQVYLALWVMSQKPGDPKFLQALRAIDGAPRGLVKGFESPKLFQPECFFPKLTEALKLLPE